MSKIFHNKKFVIMLPIQNLLRKPSNNRDAIL